MGISPNSFDFIAKLVRERSAIVIEKGKEYLVDGTVKARDVAETFAPQRFGYHRLEDLPALKGLLEPA